MTHGAYIRFKAAYLARFTRSEYRGKIGRVISNPELIQCGLVGVRIIINGKPITCCVDDIEVTDAPKSYQEDPASQMLLRSPQN